MTDSNERLEEDRRRINYSEEIPFATEGPFMASDDKGVVQLNPTSLGTDRFSTVFLATVVAAFGALNFGYALGFTSPIQGALEDKSSKFHLSEDQFSWFASLVAVGAILGSIFGGWMIDRFGRKSTLLMVTVPYAIGWLLIAVAFNIPLLYAGRILVGIAVGISSLTVPIYISEISSARLRGGLGSVNQLAVVFGIFFAYVVGWKLPWRWAAIFALGLTACLLVFMIFMPETPRWLLANNGRHAAISALEWLRGPQYDVEQECFEIESNLDQQEKISVRDFLQPELYRPLAVGMTLMVFQQFCGINAVLFFDADIFKAAGFTNSNAIAIYVSIAQFVSTGVACLIVDKSGRRVLLMVGGVGMFVCTFLLGVYFDLVVIDKSEKHIDIFGHVSHTFTVHSISWLAIGSVVVYIVLFSIGWGPLPWLIMSEIFPPRAKGIASGITTLTNWLFVFVVTKSFASMRNTFYTQGTFWFFAAFALASFFFVLFGVVETKGKTLEEIERHFSRKSQRSST